MARLAPPVLTFASGAHGVLVVGFSVAGDVRPDRLWRPRRRFAPQTGTPSSPMRTAGPWVIERAVREARVSVEGLPPEFRFHDLRHCFASLLIASGLDVKVVQARLRHVSAKTTLDTCGHLWPDRDDASRAEWQRSTRRVPDCRQPLMSDAHGQNFALWSPSWTCQNPTGCLPAARSIAGRASTKR